MDSLQLSQTLSDQHLYPFCLQDESLNLIMERVFSIQGEKVIELGQDLHSQIRAKINNTVTNNTQASEPNNGQKYITSADTKNDLTSSIEQNLSETTQDSQINTQLKAQLEQINKVLYEQIKQKVASEINRQQIPSSQNSNIVQVENAGDVHIHQCLLHANC